MLSDFKNQFEKIHDDQVLTLAERKNLVPGHLRFDLEDAVLYAYWCLNFYDDPLFMEILKLTKRFQGRRDLAELLASQGAYMRLSNEETEEHVLLCQLAFDISVERGYSEMIHNLILTKSGKITVTRQMVETFI